MCATAPGPTARRVLAGVCLLVAALACDRPAGPPADAPPPERRLLLIGLDGADWRIIDPLMEQGRMPHLQRLVRSGVRAKLRSITPMLSPVVWTSMATGVEPTRHGILDFVVADEQGNRQPVTSAQRNEPTVWEILSRRGVPVGVVGWWASWPAEAVRGYMVSDRIAYQLFGYRADPDDARGKTWPPELYPRVRENIVAPEAIGWERVAPYLSGDRREADAFDEEERTRLEQFRTLVASGESYLAIARDLAAEHDPRLEVVYFEGTDTVGHLFMPFRPPPIDGLDADSARSFAAIVDRYYETADRYIGELLEGRDERWTVMVVSDHGFASDVTRPQTTDSRIGHGPAADWHRKFGVLVLSGADVSPGAQLQEASIYDVAPTILALYGEPVPRSWPGRVLEEALDPGFLARHPVREGQDPPRGDRLVGAATNDPAASDLLEKLRSLGYVSGGEEGTGAATARNNAGLSLMAQGRHAEAEAEFRAALEEGKPTPVLWVNLAVALRYQGRVVEAEKLLEQALGSPAFRRIAGNQLANLKLAAGELAEAEALAREVIAWEPGAAEAHNTLGLILLEQGQAAAARSSFQRSAALDPDTAMARNNLGNMMRSAGELGQAEVWYREAIEADPYFMGSYNNLALVYQDLGRTEQALDLYDRALAKAPEHPIVLNNLGSLQFGLGNGDAAREYWTRASLAAPDYTSPLNNLAGLEITEGKLAQAEQRLRRAIELEPDYGDARINLAIILRSRGELDAARDELVLAAADARSGTMPWTQLGLLELQAGRPAEAARAWSRAVELQPGSVEALNGLGESYRRLGRNDEALEVWERSLAIRPGQKRLQRGVELLRGRPTS